MVSVSGFAFPAESGSNEALRALSSARLLRIIGSVLRECQDHPAISSWTEFVEANVDLLETSDLTLSPGLGHVMRAECERATVFLQVFLLLAIQGARGQFSVEFNAPGHVFVDANFLAVQGRIACQCGDGRITVSCAFSGGSKEITFARTGERWVRSPSDAEVVFRHGIEALVFNVQSVDTVALPIVKVFDLSPSGIDEIRLTLDGAIDLIARASPRYLKWIQPVLKGIVFVYLPDRTVSHSLPTCPGLVAISHPMRVDQLAVQIVHECSHQYFYALQHEGGFSIAEGEEFFYSPLRTDHRPLSMVFLAIHASLNICEFICDCLIHGETTNYLTAELDELMEGCVKAIDGLRDNAQFSAVGQDLFGALDEVMQSILSRKPSGVVV